MRNFLFACSHYLRLWWVGLTPQPGARWSLRRLLIMLLFLPALGLLQAVHWLGFLLDEILFRGYRRVRVERPVFILGVPRSGTTHLHSVMAEDEQFTTFSLWECLFGLSISARYFWSGIGRVDRWVGGPLRALLDAAQRRLMKSLDHIHPMSLREPEEDYLALLPILSCFALVVPFPGAAWLWRMGHFDRDMAPEEQQRILTFYRSCLQRHLYFHGTNKILLSKNAAFASLAGALVGFFPDSRIVCCEREPAETLPSQLSSLAGAIRLFDCDAEYFGARFVRLFEHYYAHLDEVLEALLPERLARVPVEAQRDALRETITDLYARLGLSLSEPFAARLESLAARSRQHRSRHQYAIADFGLSPAFLRERFGNR